MDEAGELIDRALASALDAAARELVVQHAEGNPFFVEELLSTFSTGACSRRERRVGLDAGGLWRSRTPCRRCWPHASTCCPPEAKDALQAAAVIGRTFSLAGLAPLSARRPRCGRSSSAALSGPAEPELVFKHALTWDVVYAQLAEGTARATARALRRLAGGAASAGTARSGSSHTTIAGRQARRSQCSPGATATRRPRGCASRLFAGSAGPPNSRSAASTSETRCGLLRAGRRADAGRRRSSGTRSAASAPSSSTARRSGRRC